jgi:hypothetical protein
MSFEKLMAKKTAEQLLPGEQFVTALRVEPKKALTRGLVGTAAGFAVLGGLGAVAGNKIAVGDAAAAPGWPQVGPMALGVTNQRILGYSISTATGRPNVFVGSIGFEHLQSVDYKHGLLPCLKVFMKDGTVAEFDVRFSKYAKRAVPLLQQLLANR